MKFKVVIEKGEDGYYVVTVPSLPGCISQGKTKEEALENIKEAIELYLEVLQEKELSKIQKAEVVEVVV
jgi:predicted RNase H-like HicB family nuclease